MENLLQITNVFLGVASSACNLKLTNDPTQKVRLMVKDMEWNFEATPLKFNCTTVLVTSDCSQKMTHPHQIRFLLYNMDSVRALNGPALD